MLKTGKIVDNPSESLYILAKYYRQKEELKPKKTYNALNDFMLAHYDNYNPFRWTNTLEKMSRIASKYPLFQIEYIPITKRELDYIQEIKNARLERIMFSFLCYAKLYNCKNESNNNWVNVPLKTIFKSARVSATITQQGLFVHSLYKMDLISLCKNTSKFNVRVLDVDNDGDAILKISDFRELGYEYMNWKNGGYFRCAECGVLCKQNKRGTRVYCNNCVGYQPIEKKIIVCVDCGKEFEVDGIVKNKNRCPECYVKHISVINQQKYKETHPEEFKNIVCVDCGCEFAVPSKDNQTTRCPECYKKYRNNYQKELMRKRRSC